MPEAIMFDVTRIRGRFRPVAVAVAVGAAVCVAEEMVGVGVWASSLSE